MTPTEQDNELREQLTNMQVEFLKKCGMDNLIPHIIDTDDNAGQAMRDDLMQLITADSKRVALEARIDELEHTFVSYDNALASELVENPEWEYGQVVERIAELKAQQEEA